jgi:threonine dehydrogenase-like Zn-dependent dehydrogenase
MKQIMLEGPPRLVASDAVPPVAGPGAAPLRIHWVGVCGIDFHAFHGRLPFFTYPRVIGHELGAEVEETPANDRGIAVVDHCTIEREELKTIIAVD